MVGIQSQNSLPQKIAIVRALRGLGDFLCAVPAWRAIRGALPEAEIVLVGLPEVEPLVRRFGGYLDRFVEFPGFPGIMERSPNVHGLPSFLSDIHAYKLDLAIQMHGSGGISNLFTVLLGARHTAGFYLPGEYCPDAARFLPYPDTEPEIWRHLQLMRFLGIPLLRDDVEFPLLAADWQALSELQELRDVELERCVCIHPGARDAARRWPAEHFARVADTLAARGYQILLTGTQAESSLTDAVARAMAFPAIDLTGKTSLGALAALLHEVQLLISNDTGVSHLAAALECKSVVIFLASDPARWAPLNRARHRVVGQGAKEHQEGSAAATLPHVRDVLSEVDILLAEEKILVA